jgi:2-hydroxychromene-2-carboxylate isomerase
MRAVQFWFEFGSTYSYPAAMRIEALAARRGITIAWRAFLLGPIFNEQGWNDSPFNIYPAKGRYMWRDLERTCAALQIPLKRPAVFPRNGLLAARIACAFAQSDWLPAFVRTVYQANFAHDQDIATQATIERCLEDVGQHPPSIFAAAQRQDAKDALRNQTAEAVRLGIFGAPTFVVGNELFWGNDRLEAAFDWSESAQGELSARAVTQG